ncbi:four helix bundle protein [Luteolibacter arcticus]|uniref:Four helix bundle protein n=2 Tax=Luteolibacter arcticus TaxID=1581411 RepID=A0ABT3GE42_9BACT|nr:four helix bundle protein [Luteolibacter arcticus]
MAAEPAKTFEDLEAWKAARELRVFVFRRVVPELRQHREFDLMDQIKRASRSVGNNIAEGYGRFHFRDNYRFCSNARGSLAETLDHLITCNDDDLISAELLAEGRELFEQALKVLNGYMLWLKRSADPAGHSRDPN